MIDSSTLASLAGKHLVGPDSEKIGKIKDVYESTDGSGGTFATVTTGLFGGGASFFPLDAADLRGNDVVVPYSKSFIKDAPRVENDEELTAPEEQRLFEYYSLGGQQGATTTTSTDTVTTGAQGFARDDDRTDRVNEHGTVGHDTSGPTTDNAMTRSEEQLRVGTEKTEAGRARLRKYVTTETETRTVPVSREEVRVEREPITDANMPNAMSGPAISEEEHEVVLTEERPVVQKEAVPVERVRMDTDTVTEQATVTEEVRKEQIDMDGATETRGRDNV
ncbi:MAG: putative conserved domain protein [uncultured Frankineae bacterium]|uniref:Putative conserved domain protein n=1 Tax=uncultured Frankineae bacterium TaxID=437475 RepID=A0A6J4KMJ6_9ACTN|nr:MAG: putative conserved domain protein [uncultured Frankineae bacterium]